MTDGPEVVTRYDCHVGEPSAVGDSVAYTDYAALDDECKALMAHRDSLEAEVERLQEQLSEERTRSFAATHGPSEPTTEPSCAFVRDDKVMHCGNCAECLAWPPAELTTEEGK